MLLERERERLLAVLQSRSSTHAERTRAREALEEADVAADVAADDEAAPNGYASDARARPAPADGAAGDDGQS